MLFILHHVYFFRIFPIQVLWHWKVGITITRILLCLVEHVGTLAPGVMHMNLLGRCLFTNKIEKKVNNNLDMFTEIVFFICVSEITVFETTCQQYSLILLIE